jgi:hypothetical protein
MRPGHEAYHSLPSSAEVKNEWSYTSAPPRCIYDVVRNSFTFIRERERERERREWGCSERHKLHVSFGGGEREHHFVRRFLGFARSSFWRV